MVRLACWLRGHDWRAHGHYPLETKGSAPTVRFYLVCERCEAVREADVITSGGIKNEQAHA